MAEPINLRRARKARDRTDKRADGDAAATRHGLTKAQKARHAADADRAARHIDGHRRDPDDGDTVE